MIWRDAVTEAISRMARKNATHELTRQQIIAEEIDQIVRDTESHGATPQQTLSRVLQELGRDGIIKLLGNGNYLLLNEPIQVEVDNLSEEGAETAFRSGKLRFGEVKTGEVLRLSKQRIGQNGVRKGTVTIYQNTCAFCEENSFLITSHIVRWGDDEEPRGKPSNVICMCCVHDQLFEHGYFALEDNYHIVRRERIISRTIRAALDATDTFRHPIESSPDPTYLARHRQRVGLT